MSLTTNIYISSPFGSYQQRSCNYTEADTIQDLVNKKAIRIFTNNQAHKSLVQKLNDYKLEVEDLESQVYKLKNNTTSSEFIREGCVLENGGNKQYKVLFIIMLFILVITHVLRSIM